MDDTDVIQALKTIFNADTGIYQQRGFQRRVWVRQAPGAPAHRLANAWTRPGHAFPCEHMDVIIPGRPAAETMPGARRGSRSSTRRPPTRDVEGPTGHGAVGDKIPVELLKVGTEAVAIDERIAPSR